jgi:hypothetical protein
VSYKNIMRPDEKKRRVPSNTQLAYFKEKRKLQKKHRRDRQRNERARQVQDQQKQCAVVETKINNEQIEKEPGLNLACSSTIDNRRTSNAFKEQIVCSSTIDKRRTSDAFKEQIEREPHGLNVACSSTNDKCIKKLTFSSRGQQMVQAARKRVSDTATKKARKP